MITIVLSALPVIFIELPTPIVAHGHLENPVYCPTIEQVLVLILSLSSHSNGEHAKLSSQAHPSTLEHSLSKQDKVSHFTHIPSGLHPQLGPQSVLLLQNVFSHSSPGSSYSLDAHFPLTQSHPLGQSTLLAQLNSEQVTHLPLHPHPIPQSLKLVQGWLSHPPPSSPSPSSSSSSQNPLIHGLPPQSPLQVQGVTHFPFTHTLPSGHNVGKHLPE